ncbi:TPA: YolD-like family protein [Candidatus Ventrenecus stercoripullorum]|nr:YolD-like family protein [Candidatus Ventrenecus stercoripullorum]
MNNRNEIKWTPFESLFQTKDVMQELERKKAIHEKPVLSEDELLEIEKNVLFAYHTRSQIQISYYYQGLTYQKAGIITAIDSNKLFFQDHSSLYFEQILKVSL